MRSKNLAGISLAVMALGFVATLFLPNMWFFFLLKGGFEAGLVGGIADWFAVTALFRHPFGLRIPHTSLLLKNKEKIINALIKAVEEDMLSKQSIESKLRRFNLLRQAASMLTGLVRRRAVRRGILDAAIRTVGELPVEKAVPWVQEWMSSYVRQADMNALAEGLVSSALHARYDEKAFDFVVQEALKWIDKPESGRLLGRIANEKLSAVKTGGFAGFAIQAFAGFMDEEKLGGMLQNMLRSAVSDARHSDNPLRETILREIRVHLFQLAGDDERMERLRASGLSWVGDGERGGAFILQRLVGVRGSLLERMRSERDAGGRVVFTLYRHAVRSLAGKPDVIEQWENRLLGYIVALVEANHYRIGTLVRENLERLDDVTLVRMLEDKVGQDLQWIRVNGAVCGFFVGIVLAAIELAT